MVEYKLRRSTASFEIERHCEQSRLNLKLDKVTITDGFSEFGGGILNLGTLTVSNSTFSSNYSRTYSGRILNAVGAVLTVTNSTFSDNHAYFNSGGGILNYETLTDEQYVLR